MSIIDVLAHAKIQHVQLFILDVEGAELLVLESIDFNAYHFDVIVIEANGQNFEPFFKSKPYKMIAIRGRNI